VFGPVNGEPTNNALTLRRRYIIDLDRVGTIIGKTTDPKYHHQIRQP
jgi:hypothetical protein